MAAALVSQAIAMAVALQLLIAPLQQLAMERLPLDDLEQNWWQADSQAPTTYGYYGLEVIVNAGAAVGAEHGHMQGQDILQAQPACVSVQSDGWQRAEGLVRCQVAGEQCNVCAPPQRNLPQMHGGMSGPRDEATSHVDAEENRTYRRAWFHQLACQARMLSAMWKSRHVELYKTFYRTI